MSRFSQLMQRGQRKVHYRERQAKLLMTLSDEQHKAIAQLLQYWLNDDESAKTGAKQPDRQQ
ncbi:MAG: hypothetical protein HWE26_19905 [Alteromonadaceae bacterium]|nr:hypothetical protein [Alteromonadaceae bacterium]